LTRAPANYSPGDGLNRRGRRLSAFWLGDIVFRELDRGADSITLPTPAPM
jgi:hypothetical protein